jgi:hypothetical protein
MSHMDLQFANGCGTIKTPFGLCILTGNKQGDNGRHVLRVLKQRRHNF